MLGSCRLLMFFLHDKMYAKRFVAKCRAGRHKWRYLYDFTFELQPFPSSRCKLTCTTTPQLWKSNKHSLMLSSSKRLTILASSKTKILYKGQIFESFSRSENIYQKVSLEIWIWVYWWYHFYKVLELCCQRSDIPQRSTPNCDVERE